MSANREKLKFEFLQNAGLNQIQRLPLKSDASFRRYERIIKNEGSSLIFMDAPPEKEETKPFIKVANYLNEVGLSAPHIYQSDTDNGFILLEDFGDNLYEKILSDKAETSVTEEELYEAAVDALIHLHKSPIDKIQLDFYDDTMQIKESMRFIDWYVSILNGENLSKKVIDEYVIILKHLIDTTKAANNVVVLRDYHAENLIWLKDRQGFKKAGLLDFQDAVIGSPAYDLVSLLEDARREISPQLADKMIARYLKAFPHYNYKDFLANYAICGIQRNLKIVGFCAAQASKHKNPYYLSLLPRVWRYINNDLKHPLLLPMKTWLNKVVPMQMKLYKPHL